MLKTSSRLKATAAHPQDRLFTCRRWPTVAACTPAISFSEGLRRGSSDSKQS
jgi:hypothetical protein